MPSHRGVTMAIHQPFTLWSVSEDGGYAKLKSSTDYDALGSLIF